MEAIVLAGGLGTRLRSSVPNLPKPLAPVNGRPFLEHVLDYWLAQGASRFILSVGYRHEQVVARFGNRYRDREIAYAVETTPLGTGGGLLKAVTFLKGEGPVLVLNGDTWFGVTLSEMLEWHRGRRAALTIALFQATDTGRYQPVDLDGEQRVTGWGRSAGKPGWANGGVYLFATTRNLVALRAGEGKVSLEGELIPGMTAAGERVYGYCSAARFIDIGVPGDYERAGAFFRDG